MAVCPKCGQDNPDRFVICGMCGTPLSRPYGGAREMRRTVTVVFCDVAGSTAMGDRSDPEVVRATMTAFFARVGAVLERHGGTVEKFIGDAAMAVFGVPVLHEDDALRAVRAAGEIQAVLRDLRIPARIGVNTGEVVAHYPGNPVVTGDAVNVAARLEQLAVPGDVLIGDATYQLVKGAVVAERTEPLVAKGKPSPLSAWRLVSVDNAAPPFPRRMDTPMIGRENELSLLRNALARADRERRCHLFTLLGPPGVGKSRLVMEFARTSADMATVLVGQCLSYGQGITYWPVAEILRAAAGVSDADDRSAAMSRLEAFVADEPDAAELADRLASVVGLGGTAAEATEINWAIRRAFERLGRERPVILVFEDVNWAEPALLDLIDDLAVRCRSSAILLVCTARPELLDERASWGGGKPNSTTILVDPLNDAECDSLVSVLAPDRPISARRRARVIEVAEGNPLFVEQMIAITSPGEDDVEVPATISALLAARLEQLTDVERRVVECASIEGRVFHRSAVDALLPAEDVAASGECLRSLTQHELIDPHVAQFERQEAYRFQHLLIRDAVYRSILKGVRADHHERFAGWLERVAGDRLDEYAEILAHHLAAAAGYRRELEGAGGSVARLGERAADLYRQAADRAAVRSDYVAGATMLARVAELLPTSDRRVALALVDRAHWLRWLQPAQASAAAGDAARAAAACGASAEQLVEICAEFVRLSSGEREVDPDGLLERAQAEAERVDDTDPWAAARLWWIVATVAETHLSRSTIAARAATRTRELAGIAGAEWLRADATGILIQATAHGPGDIGELLATGERLAAGAGGLRRGMYLDNRALLLAQRGELDAALEVIGEAAAIWEEYGLSAWLAYGPAWLRGSVFLLAGQPGEAVPALRSALERAAEHGGESYRSTIEGLLSRALALAGEYESALEHCQSARAGTREGDVLSEILWRGAGIRAMAGLGHTSGLAQQAAELCSVASRVEAPEVRFDALIDAAHGLSAAGQQERARELVTQELTESRLRGARSLIEQAERALAGLGAPLPPATAA